MILEKSALVERLGEVCFGLKEYKMIMANVNQVTVSTDKDFQRTFNHFYKVRRNETWRLTFYKLFEECKNKPELSFNKIITDLYQSTGNVEASFSSKMLATINPNMPIWDANIMKYFDYKLTGNNNEERVHNAIRIYDALIKEYAELLAMNDAKECISIFDSIMPSYRWLSSIKKIDYLILLMGRDETQQWEE